MDAAVSSEMLIVNSLLDTPLPKQQSPNIIKHHSIFASVMEIYVHVFLTLASLEYEGPVATR
jgi:hypothetical protein